MIAFLSIIHVMVAILLVISILLQSSRGGGLAGMFGGGGMSGMFGGRGAASFLSKVTMWLAIGFAFTCLFITLSTRPSGKQSDQEQSAVGDYLQRRGASVLSQPGESETLNTNSETE